MTAKIIPFPSQGRVRLAPIDVGAEYLPPAVRQLLAIMEAKERKYGSNMPPEGMTADEHIRDVAPHLVRPGRSELA
jgi:hypothetical protein